MATVTKGFDSLNSLIDDFKIYLGKDHLGAGEDMMDMGDMMGY